MFLRNRWKNLVSALVMLFNVSSGGALYATGGDALFIDQNGSVGVGTQSPTATLDVKGDLNVSGKVKSIGSTPVGGIIMFCDGAALEKKNKFDERGSGVKGTEYEGRQLCNGQNGAPDLRDRFVVGVGTMYKTGAIGGADSVTLTVDQMPAHNHQLYMKAYVDPDKAKGTEWVFPLQKYTYGLYSDRHNMNTAGGNQPHENRPPYYAIAFLVRMI